MWDFPTLDAVFNTVPRGLESKGSAAVRPNDDVIAARLSTRKVAELTYGLLRSESSLLSVDVDTREVEASDAHAGERIEHPLRGVEVGHSHPLHGWALFLLTATN